MNKKCPRCFHDMKNHANYYNYIHNTNLRTKWVCLDCGEVI